MADRCPLITAINEAYFPGLKALYNSYKANAGDGFDFFCIVHGDSDLFARVEDLGVTAIKPLEWGTLYPTTQNWPVSLPAMYSRLLIPQMFAEYRRAIWLDADCIILEPIKPLLDIEFGETVAVVTFTDSRYTLGFQIRDLPQELRNIRGLFAGLLLFNIAEWNRQKITQRCTEAMNADSGLDFRYVVQSVLGYVLQGKFHTLPYHWQVFANRTDSIPKDVKILHYVGALPWKDEMNNQEIWATYA